MPKIFKNATRLTIKLFVLVWAFLILQIVLKLTFNYWQPYVIPTKQLEGISNFIDANSWLKIIIDGLLYIVNVIIMLLCSLQIWWFKNKRDLIIAISTTTICYVLNRIYIPLNNFTPFITTLILPIVLNYKKWLTTIITFALSNIFLFLSLFLEGFVNSNDMPYIIKIFLEFDYYIMLGINYMLFNLIRQRKDSNYGI